MRTKHLFILCMAMLIAVSCLFTLADCNQGSSDIPGHSTEIANSTNLMPGSYKKLTHGEIYDVLMECK